ncbi:MAG: BamA/TamA family outer membrane protein [Elusimicrobiota bacterium]
MKRAAPFAALLLGLAALAVSPAHAQFGRNQVVTRDFEWKVVSTEHFDIHYYEESAPMVPFAARVLESSYARLSRTLRTDFKGARKPFFLYGSANEMQQSSIVDAGDGTGGITEPFKDRFLVYHDGSRRWLDTVASHELAHVFQFHVLISGFWKSAQILKTIVYPLWFMEGMAEWSTKGLDETAGEVLMRDAATSKTLIPLWKLEHFSHLKPHQVRLAYESGASALEFIESQYGEGRVERMLKLFDSKFESGAVLQDVTGLDVFAFDRRWREYLEERYAAQVRRERLQEPAVYGRVLTTAHDRNIPESNSSPVPLPGRKAVAYLSTRDGFPPALMLLDLSSGKTRTLLDLEPRIETVELGRFADLSRVLAASPDGRRLAFTGKRNHRDSLYLYDLETRRLERVPLPGLSDATQPAFSPDGRSVALAGMKEALTDLWLLDLSTRRLRRLTEDPQDDQTPSFSPDGRSIVYTSEAEVEGDAMPYQRRLRRLDLFSGMSEELSALRGAARDPVVSPDGRRVLFALEKDGSQDLHELELATGRVERLTRTVGAAYTPAYAPDGSIAFASLRGGSVQLYAGNRADFLSEPVLRGKPAPAAPTRSPATVSVSTTPLFGSERAFRDSFGSDLFLPAFFYSSNGGFFWTSYWQGSDMLGIHQAQGLMTYASGEGYVDYQAAYQYSRWRPRFVFQSMGTVYNRGLDTSKGWNSNESAHTQAATMAYPLDRFQRVELTAAAVTDRYNDVNNGERIVNDARIAAAAYVRDTVKGRYLVATGGSRLRLGYLESPRVLGGNFIYRTASVYASKYVPTGGLSAFALRGFAVQSVGPQTPQYALGGFSSVRGYGYSTVTDVGSRMALGTAEWRFPLWGNLDYYMWYMFPDFYFKAVSAAVFTDAGYAWDTSSQLEGARWRDVRHSYGAGLRLHVFILQLFPLVVHFDYARRTTTPGGVFYVYLGPMF